MIRGIVVIHNEVKKRQQIRQCRYFTKPTTAPQHSLLVLASRSDNVYNRIVGVPPHRSIKIPSMLDETRPILAET